MSINGPAQDRDSDEELASAGTPAGFDLLEQVRSEAGHLPSVAELLRHADRWIEDASTRPLEAYLALPTTAAKRRQYRRNKWLTRAAREIDASGPCTGALRLKAELDHFLTRGPWFAWRNDAAPPENATPLRAALFWAAKFNDGEDLTARTLQTIVGSVWPKKFPTIAPTLSSSMDAQEVPDEG